MNQEHAQPPFSERPVYVPLAGPPLGPGPSKEIYAVMGETNIFDMCEVFYENLARSSIRSLFPEDMKQASEKIAAFLVGLFGGPPLYHQRYGAPQMRKRHLAVPIDEEARQVWLSCFKEVLETAPQRFRFPEEHKDGFIEFLESFSAWMVNKQ